MNPLSRVVSAARRLAASAALFAFVVAGSAAARADEPQQFGAYATELTGLAGPAGAAYFPDGRLAVAEEQAHRVRVFAFAAGTAADSGAAGGSGGAWTQVLEIGRFGRGPGEFDRPRGVAVSPGGELFVVDAGNQRVQVFDASGAFLRTFGGYGSAAGQLCDPRGIALGEQVYVADTGNARVQVFTLAGEFVAEWGGFGLEPPRMGRPVAVATAGPDVFVSDADQHRILHFRSDGTLVGSWGEWGYFPGLLAEPAGLAAHAGRVFVADLRNHRAQAFGYDGQRQYEWGLHAIRPREAGGKLHYPDGLTLSPDGRWAGLVEHFENRVQFFGLETAAQAAARFNPSPPGSGPPSAHFGEYMDIDGEWMAVTEPDSHSVLVYDLRGPEPINVHKLGGYGRGAGRFVRPADVHVWRAERRLTVADAGNRRLQEFELRPGTSPDVEFLPRMSRLMRSMDLERLSRQVPLLAEGQVLAPTAIERDAAGNFYLLDSVHDVLAVLDQRLAFDRAWGGTGDAPGQFRAPSDLAFDPGGTELYVVDSGNRRIQRLNVSSGAAVVFTDGFGGADGGANGARTEFAWPFGVVAGGDGRVYVSDLVRDSVAVFSAQGTWLTAWGGRGLAAREFYRPATMGFDPLGRLMVIDYANHRGQVFSPDGQFAYAFGARLFVAPTQQRPEGAE